jgi:hypothetical protein
MTHSISDSIKAAGPAAVRFPERLRGIFERRRNAFAALLAEARKRLQAQPVPAPVRCHYDYVVLAPQPAFMPLPLVYLELATQSGPLGARHKDYLPWLMLALELCGVLDDTVDQTARRSGRDTYPWRYGPCSSAPLCCFLLNLLTARTRETAPELLPLVGSLFETQCALKVWEFEKCYPAVDAASCHRWLQRRYDEVTPAVSYGFDSALLLAAQRPLPAEAGARFAEIVQDVDDLVNLGEDREGAGDNVDFKLGLVTYPLVAALERDPGLRGVAERVWGRYRAARRVGGDPMIARGFVAADAPDLRCVLEGMAALGIPATLERIERNAAACVAATPHQLRGTMREFVGALVERAQLAGKRPEPRPELRTERRLALA